MTFTLILKTSRRLPLSLKCFLNLFLQDTRIYLRPYGWLLLCNVFWVLSVPADAFQDWLQYELYFSQEIKPVFFLQAEFVLPVLEVKRSSRNYSKLFLLRSNTIPTERLSKQRAGKMQKNADDSLTWNIALSLGHSTLNSTGISDLTNKYPHP